VTRCSPVPSTQFLFSEDIRFDGFFVFLGYFVLGIRTRSSGNSSEKLELPNVPACENEPPLTCLISRKRWLMTVDICSRCTFHDCHHQYIISCVRYHGIYLGRRGKNPRYLKPHRQKEHLLIIIYVVSMPRNCCWSYFRKKRFVPVWRRSIFSTRSGRIITHTFMTCFSLRNYFFFISISFFFIFWPDLILEMKDISSPNLRRCMKVVFQFTVI
jgi:hypothetical protein